MCQEMASAQPKIKLRSNFFFQQSNMSNDQQQLQQQQQAWQNYYAYQQQYYASQQQQHQQPPAYPFAAGAYQQQQQIPGPPPPVYGAPYQAQQQPPPPPPPPQQLYHCDACDLSLESSIAHQAHIKSHITCTDCPYVASPKLVKAHHSSAHGKFKGRGFKTVTVSIPGCKVQRYRICVGNHPDDVKKWIADRRKKFPRKEEPKEAEAVPVQQLGGLLDGYGSSSSEEDTKKAELLKDIKPPPDTTATKTPAPSSNASNVRSQVCRYFARHGKCRNGDACPYRHEKSNSTAPKPKMLGKKKTGTAATLLKKLLKTDADRETTLTLQLLRYIVDCNYLQEQRDKKSDNNA